MFVKIISCDGREVVEERRWLERKLENIVRSGEGRRLVGYCEEGLYWKLLQEEEGTHREKVRTGNCLHDRTWQG